jgi:hypothetical protein
VFEWVCHALRLHPISFLSISFPGSIPAGSCSLYRRARQTKCGIVVVENPRVLPPLLPLVAVAEGPPLLDVAKVRAAALCRR